MYFDEATLSPLWPLGDWPEAIRQPHLLNQVETCIFHVCDFFKLICPVRRIIKKNLSDLIQIPGLGDTVLPPRPGDRTASPVLFFVKLFDFNPFLRYILR